MRTIIAWMVAHPTTTAMTAFWLFSNAVSAMPTPSDKDGKGYRWAFGFLHSLAGNAARLVAVKYPSVATSLGISSQDLPKTP